MKLQKLLPFFSYLFHPIFISLYGTVFYFLVTPVYFHISQVYVTLIQVVILTLILPLAVYFLLVSLGWVTSFTEASVKQRKFPLVVQIFLLGVLLKFGTNIRFIPELFSFFYGGFFSAVLALAFAFLNYKASLHTIGISALACFVYAVCLYHQLPFIIITAFTIVCVGLVASSRLYMKSHTAGELAAGMIIGILPQLIVWYLYGNQSI